ncbi:MAG: DUF3540 domain-containing protein [Minicystis sp.]
MRNLARKQQQQDREVLQHLGTVTRIEGATLVVETDTREIVARRAASCLLDPVPGDVVIIAVVGYDQGYVLAVLEREAGAPASIALDGDLDIKLRNGRFGVAAQEGVSLSSGSDVSVVSGTVNVRAVDGSVAVERLSFLGTFLRAEIARAKVFAESFDTVLDRAWQKVKRSYRIVEETDHVRAEQIDYAARKALRMHGENALITAENLAKVEGDQIHLG